jgi:subtilisin family serine protease
LASQGITANTTITECENNPNYPNFFGTSAAAPHAAGIAALIRQANSAATPTQIYSALRTGALPMTGSGATPNLNSGYGFIQADAALALIPPGAPTLTLAPASIATGASTTITWSSVNATSCTASGSWSGALASSGSETLTPMTAGSDTYSLTCANAAGNSPASTATLTVTAAPASGGGGGGALGGLSLVGLAAMRAARSLRGRIKAG